MGLSYWLRAVVAALVVVVVLALDTHVLADTQLPSSGQLSQNALNAWVRDCRARPGVTYETSAGALQEAARQWAVYFERIGRKETNNPMPTVMSKKQLWEKGARLMEATQGDFPGQLATIYAKVFDLVWKSALGECYAFTDSAKHCRKEAGAWAQYDSRYTDAMLESRRECEAAEKAMSANAAAERLAAEERARQLERQLAEKAAAEAAEKAKAEEAERRAAEITAWQAADKAEAERQAALAEQQRIAAASQGQPGGGGQGRSATKDAAGRVQADGEPTLPAAEEVPWYLRPDRYADVDLAVAERDESYLAATKPTGPATENEQGVGVAVDSTTAVAATESSSVEAADKRSKITFGPDGRDAYGWTREDHREFRLMVIRRLRREREQREKRQREAAPYVGLASAAVMLGFAAVYGRYDGPPPKNSDTALDGDLGPFGFEQAMFSVAALVPMIAALPLAKINAATRERLSSDIKGWLAELAPACAAGRQQSCGELLSLARTAENLQAEAKDRSDASVLLGVGSPLGPAWELMSTVQYASGALHATVPREGGTLILDGTMEGAAFETVFRRRLIRVVAGYTHRYGDPIDDTQAAPNRLRHTSPLGVQSFSFGLGIQPFSGLLSPYADLRARHHSMTSSVDLAEDLANGAGSFVETMPSLVRLDAFSHTDLALSIGNSFHLGFVGSARGPWLGSLALQLGYEWSLSDGALVDSVISAGLAYSVAKPGSYAKPLSLQTAAERVAFTGVMVHGSHRAVGAEFGRFVQGRSANAMFDAQLAFDGSSLDGLQLSLMLLGREVQLGAHHRLGLGLAPTSVMVAGLAKDSEAKTFGVGMARAYYRLQLAKVAVEVGARTPVVWLEETPQQADPDASDYALYQGVVPFQGYLGVGF